MTDPTKEELLEATAADFDTESLTFPGLRGDASRHLNEGELLAAITALPPAPRDRGRVAMLVARGPRGERNVLDEALLTVEGGLLGDRWVNEERYGPQYQLATTRADIARTIANGQPLELHGDNLYLDLDLSSDNLPSGTIVEVGTAHLIVTPQAHNGCKKWTQRFGLAPMQLNLAPNQRQQRIRGMYFRVGEDGRVRVGDSVTVVERGYPAGNSAS